MLVMVFDMKNVLLHLVLRFLHGAWECLSFRPASQCQVLSRSTCLVVISLRRKRCDVMMWALVCCVEARCSWVLLLRRGGNEVCEAFPWRSLHSSMKKFGISSSLRISENQSHLKPKCCVSLQAVYDCTVLLLVCWSKSVQQLAKAGFRAQRVPLGICACARKQCLEAEFFVPLPLFYIFLYIYVK